MKKYDIRSIIERMKEIANTSSDKNFAEFLGVPTSTVSNWKTRDSIPFDVVAEFSANHQVNTDWLIFGKENALGEMETELLARFAKLDFKQKLKLLTSLEEGDFAKNGTHQTAHGSGNNQQVFSGDVGKVVGIQKNTHYQRLKKASAYADTIIPKETQALARKMQANVDKIFPQEIQALNRKMQALTAKFPIDTMQRWQKVLTESNNPEDYALFHSPAYKETEKRVELGIAEEPEKQLVISIGNWAKTKKISKKVINTALHINTLLDLWEHVEKIFEQL